MRSAAFPVDTLPPRISSWVGQAGFALAMSEGHRGTVRLVPGARRVGLVVAHETGPGSPVADDLAVRVPSAATTVWAHDYGLVVVRVSFAPPALLVPADAAAPVTMVPQVPGEPGEVHLAPGDRLVVLTATAFDQAPQVVARLVRGDDLPPGERHRVDDLRSLSDTALLRRLLRHAPSAAGVVIRRTSAPPSPSSVPLLHPTDRRFR
ncbi:MAG: hypothetical protein M3Y71_07635 [Actinomycetota bacterium]|nr:hypothetical protein [Actinomycetota bacterium]